MANEVERNPLIFQAHDAYYAWRNVVPRVGDITITERERELVTTYIDRLENTVLDLSETPEGSKMAPWPWETIDRD